LRLSFYGNDELGSLALANVDLPEEQALKLILNYLRSPNGKKLKSEATAFDGNDVDDIVYAREVYNRAKELITKRKDGKVNTDLLNQIRISDPDFPLGKGTDSYVIKGQLGLDDVRDIDIEDLPLEYVGPELIPVVDAAQRTSTLMQNGWVWLGLANARMSRQPMAIYESILFRKEMRASGFEQKFIEQWTQRN
jgi:hypothetical protein